MKTNEKLDVQKMFVVLNRFPISSKNKHYFSYVFFMRSRFVLILEEKVCDCVVLKIDSGAVVNRQCNKNQNQIKNTLLFQERKFMCGCDNYNYNF